MLANLGTLEYLQGTRCCLSECPFDGATIEHHDRLLTVDQDLDQAMALMELAVTWGELDYSEAPLIAPSQWSDFVALHCWQHPGRAERVFSLAGDAATHSVTAGHAFIGVGPRATPARVGPRGSVFP